MLFDSRYITCYADLLEYLHTIGNSGVTPARANSPLLAGIPTRWKRWKNSVFEGWEHYTGDPKSPVRLDSGHPWLGENRKLQKSLARHLYPALLNHPEVRYILKSCDLESLSGTVDITENGVVVETATFTQNGVTLGPTYSTDPIVHIKQTLSNFRAGIWANITYPS